MSRNSGVWLGWHVVLMQRADPWHYQYTNHKPLDFILPAFTLVLASIRVACVRSLVSDSLGRSFNFCLEVCVWRNVDSRASGKYLGCGVVIHLDCGWTFEGLP